MRTILYRFFTIRLHEPHEYPRPLRKRPACLAGWTAHVAVEFQRYRWRLWSGRRSRLPRVASGLGSRGSGAFEPLGDPFSPLRAEGLTEIENATMRSLYVYLLQLREHLQAQTWIDRRRIRWGFTSLAFRRRTEFTLRFGIAGRSRGQIQRSSYTRRLHLSRCHFALLTAYNPNRRRRRVDK